MRRRLYVLPSVIAAAALVLSACSSTPEDDADPTPTSSATSTEEMTPVEVPSVENVVAGNEAGFTASGAFGEKPTVEFTADAAPEGLQVETVIEGDGATVAAGDSVVAHYLGQVWGSDEVFDNSYDRGAPTPFSLNQVIPGWTTGLAGQKVGSRVLLSVPSFLGYGAQGSGEIIKPGDDLVFVVDLLGVVPADGTGQADAAVAEPAAPVTVTGGLGEPVTDITLEEGLAEPTEVTVTVIATGTGPAIAATDVIGIQYYLESWDGESVESSWPPAGPGAQANPVQGTVFEDLVGVPGGSRVLLQLPGNPDSGALASAVVVDVTTVVSP